MGVGLLLVRDGVRLGSRLFGGGQQQGRRPGTVAVPLAVGLATALELWQAEAEGRIARWKRLRDRLEAGLTRRAAGRVGSSATARSTSGSGCRRRSTSASPASTATPS